MPTKKPTKKPPTKKPITTAKKPATKAKPASKPTKDGGECYAVAKDLFLVRKPLTAGAPVMVASNVNHIAIIDCSGSMSGDLPQIRDQLKRQLPKLLKDGDTFSLIWFSGRDQAGVLLDAEPVATLADLDGVNKAIDRWLRPVGLTGFVKPLTLAEDLVQTLGRKNKNPFALFFMTDGCDNQWDRSAVLRAVEKTTAGLASATFVEYGYYADRALLSAMAAKAGGELIFADAFDKYAPKFEAAITRQVQASRRIEVKIDDDAIGGFVFSLNRYGHDDKIPGELVSFELSNGAVHVPEGTEEIWYLSPTPVGVVGDLAQRAAFAGARNIMNTAEAKWLYAGYAALSLYSTRMMPNVIYPLLKTVGDVRFINLFSSCFGKQKYSEFMEEAKAAAFSAEPWYRDGYNPNLVPPDDAFTVLDLLKVLAADDDARLLLEHPEFTYSRVSRGRLNADENLSVKETARLETLRAELANERKATEIKRINDEIAALVANKQQALTFEATPAPDGYPINGLVYNEDRANVSMRVLKPGLIDISTRLAAGMPGYGLIPPKIDTQIWRNYTLIKDGLVNIEQLPVRVRAETYGKLARHGVAFVLTGAQSVTHATGVINVKPLPIINRKMAASPSALALANNELDLIEARCAQKVFKWYVDEKYGIVKTDKLEAKYGEDGAAWLKDQGITDGGFNPKMVQAEAKDFYMGRELCVKVAGYSTIPSVNALNKKLAEGKKLNGPETIMQKFVVEIERFLKDQPPSVHEKWLKGKSETWIATARGYIQRAAEIKFAILVGQVWFKEFKTLDDKTVQVTRDGKTHDVTFELNEVEIEI